MAGHLQNKSLSGTGMRFGIVSSRWHETVVEKLVARAQEALIDAGVLDEDIVTVEVSGSYELPFAALGLAAQKLDGIVAVGCLVKGETMHFEYIADAVSHGLMRVQLDTKTPTLFGVLTCTTLEQALVRAAADGHDLGYAWGMSAIEMAHVKRRLFQD